MANNTSQLSLKFQAGEREHHQPQTASTAVYRRLVQRSPWLVHTARQLLDKHGTPLWKKVKSCQPLGKS